jgi:hypothetical protein
VRLRAFITPFDNFRKGPGRFLLVHRRGEYQYRNPDSLFVHPFEWFSTREDAEQYLSNRVAKSEQSEWQLFELVGAGR